MEKSAAKELLDFANQREEIEAAKAVLRKHGYAVDVGCVKWYNENKQQ